MPLAAGAVRVLVLGGFLVDRKTVRNFGSRCCRRSPANLSPLAGESARSPHVFTCVCMYMGVYVSACRYIWTFVPVSRQTKTLYEYVNVSVHVYTDVQTYVHASVHVHVYVDVYLYMHVNMCVCGYMHTVVYRCVALRATNVVWPSRCAVAPFHSARVLGYFTCMHLYRHTCLCTYTYSCTCGYML